jgi:hypothetical protein
MPTARSGFAIAVFQNKIYVFGGATSETDYTGVNEVYDPVTNTWTAKASMPTARADLSASVVGDKIYLIGGKKHLGVDPYYSEVDVNEAYDPVNDAWTTKSPMPASGFGYASAVADGKIYVIGGAHKFWTEWDISDLNSNRVYNPENDSWSVSANLPTAVSYAAAAATADFVAPKRIYVFGGHTQASNASGLVQAYDVATNAWRSGASMPTGRLYSGVAVVNDVLYAIGGFDGENWLNANEEYLPVGYGTLPPELRIASPEEKVYNVSSIRLLVSANRVTSWLGYSLDNHANVTVKGDTELSGLSQGSHSIVVYGNDTFGNMGASGVVSFSVDTVPPRVVVLVPEDATYGGTDIQTEFTVDEPVSWMAYSLDGQDNVTVTGNVTLAVLENGAHSLKVYATDLYGNTGVSRTVRFSIEPFPTVWVVAVAVTITIAVAAGYLLIKRRKTITTKKTK